MTKLYSMFSQFSSVAQSCPTLRPHESQHARPPCPSPTPGVHSNSRPSSQGCQPAMPHKSINYRLFCNKQPQFSSVQLLSRVQLFVTPWTAAGQASNTQSLLKLISIESVMPSNHLILCCPFLLLPSIFLSISVFSNESSLFKGGKLCLWK